MVSRTAAASTQAGGQLVAPLGGGFQVAEAGITALGQVLVVDMGNAAQGVLHCPDLDIHLIPVPGEDFGALRRHGLRRHRQVDQRGQQQLAFSLVIGGRGAGDSAEFFHHGRAPVQKCDGRNMITSDEAETKTARRVRLVRWVALC